MDNKNTFFNKFIEQKEVKLKIKDINLKFICFLKLKQSKLNYILFSMKEKVENILEADYIEIKVKSTNKILVLKLFNEYTNLETNIVKNLFFFRYNGLIYFYDFKLNMFKILNINSNTIVENFINNYKNGISKEEYEKKTKIFNKNIIDFKKKKYINHLFNEIFSFLGIYELACIYIYYLEKLQNAAIILSLIYFFELNKLIQQNLLKEKEIEEIIYKKDNVIIYRRNDEGDFNKIIEDKTNLVIGDLIEVLENYEIPADCILIKGSLILDESKITGESKLIYKNGIDNLNIIFKDIPQENLLYSGTICKKSLNNLEFNNLAIVIRTGNYTNQGIILRKMLGENNYNKDNKFLKEVKFLFKILIGFSIIFIFIFNIIDNLKNNNKFTYTVFKNKFLLNLDLFFNLIKPEIPICILKIVNYLSEYLETFDIKTKNSYKIFECSSIKYLIFDPFNWLVKSSLNDSLIKIFDKNNKIINKKYLPYQLKKSLGFLSNVLIVKKNLIGNDFEKIIFKLSELNFKSNFVNNKIINTYIDKKNNKYILLKNNKKNKDDYLSYTIIKDEKLDKLFIYILGHLKYFSKIFPYDDNKNISSNLLIFRKEINNINLDNDNISDLMNELEIDEFLGSIFVPYEFENSVGIFKTMKINEINIKLFSKCSLYFNLDYCYFNQLLHKEYLYNLDYSETTNIVTIEKIDFSYNDYKIVDNIIIDSILKLDKFLNNVSNNKLCLSNNFINYIYKLLNEKNKDKNYLLNIYNKIKNNGFIFYNLDHKEKNICVLLLKHRYKEGKIMYIGNDSTSDLNALKNSDISIVLNNNSCSINSDFIINNNFENTLNLINTSKISLINTKIFIYYTILFCFLGFIGGSFLYIEDIDTSNIGVIYVDLVIYLFISISIIKNIPKKKYYLEIKKTRFINRNYLFFLIINILICATLMVFVVIYLKNYFKINEKNANFIIFMFLSFFLISNLLSIKILQKSKVKKFIYFFNLLIMFMVCILEISPNFNCKFFPKNDSMVNLKYYFLIVLISSLFNAFFNFLLQMFNNIFN